MNCSCSGKDTPGAIRKGGLVAAELGRILLEKANKRNEESDRYCAADVHE